MKPAAEFPASDAAAAAAELERTREFMEQFAYAASHDLQEPVRGIASYLQLLQARHAGALPDEARTFLGHALDGTQRLQQMLDDLLLFSRAGTQALHVTDMDARVALDDAVEALAAPVATAGARIEIAPLPRVRADPALLRIVFQNILGNALKFSAGAPVVHVDAAAGGPPVRLRIRDNGIGVPPECTERIFGVFQRLHAHGRYDGTGMGLPVARRILERFDGRIRCIPAGPGAGTCFEIELPPAENPT